MALRVFFCLATLAAAQIIQFDGRVPAGTPLTAFDADNGLFSPSNVFGKGLKPSELLLLPVISPSLFDIASGTVPLEVTIRYIIHPHPPARASHPIFFRESSNETLTMPLSDASIFAPSADNVQVGFRRAELNPASNNGTDASTTGVKVLHFSIMKDTARPLNLSHEYQMVFLESADFSTNQVVLKTGTILDRATADPDQLMLFSNVKNASLLFSTAFTPGVFHNFGVALDFTRK